jgi:PAS domain S-box-containing protein
MDLDSFYEARPVTTVVIGAEGEECGRIVSASLSFADLVGCTPDALVGRAAFDFVHRDDRSRACDEFTRLVARRASAFDGVGRMLSASGSVRWLGVHASLTGVGPESTRLLVHVFALPVRLLSVNVAKAQRASSTDRLAVALNLEPVGSAQAAV